MMRPSVERRSLAAVLAGLLSLGVHAAPGVTDTEILLGQTAALEGPTSALGQGMRAGLLAGFAEVNDSGGINGRRIRLISKDDGYEPDRAIANARELIDQDKVFLLIGSVGTPTAKVILPICEERGVPLVAPFTGAGLLRAPFRKLVVNLRASYPEEMERLAQFLVDQKKLTRIACFFQSDDYGQAGLKGIEAALKRRNLELAVTGTYERNTTAVKGALLDIRKANPEAVVMVGTYKPCAEFIKLGRKLGMKDTLFCNISFVGTRALVAELGGEGEGTLITQVVPAPSSEAPPVVKSYAQALRKQQPDAPLDWISLEGYLAAKLFCAAVAKGGRDLDRESFLSVLEQTGSFDLGGLKAVFGPEDHQGLDDVFLTVIKGNEAVPAP
jgi:ABC-type branched-subunit amino acid transport system substrate-binding protein